MPARPVVLNVVNLPVLAVVAALGDAGTVAFVEALAILEAA